MFISPSSAVFAMEYPPPPARPKIPADELVNTMRP